jgi:hypothetical protein
MAQADSMRSKWLTHKNKQILYQDFSGYSFLDMEPLKQELADVQAIVIQAPQNSVLVLTDFRQTRVGKDLMDLLTASSSVTKAHIKKTAVLGVTGTKRILADMLIRLTGQQLSFFDQEEAAKDWLVQ